MTQVNNSAYVKTRYARDPEFRRRRLEACARCIARKRQDPVKYEEMKRVMREYMARRRARLREEAAAAGVGRDGAGADTTQIAASVTETT